MNLNTSGVGAGIKNGLENAEKGPGTLREFTYIFGTKIIVPYSRFLEYIKVLQSCACLLSEP